MYKVCGKVIKGDGYGKKLGFPTANLDRRDYSRRKLKIKFGVYAGIVKIDSKFEIRNSKKNQKSEIKNPKSFKAGIVIGPMDKNKLPKIEAHLIGFKGNLYGKKITINLQKYLRPFKKFKNETELKKQIKLDIKRIS